MSTLARYLIQGMLYAAFAATVGYFSNAPTYRHLGADDALVRLSFSHAAQRVAPCRERTPEELAKLAPNMRAPLDCPRERSPVTVELELDGRLVFRNVVAPAGLRRDLASTVYWRQAVAAGEHRFTARMKDRPEGGFNFVKDVVVELAPGRVLVIDFDGTRGGFLFRM
ncbi:MAG: hypothetical protein FJY54_04220 [Betaproteobacteria bacterium]|nr:hypothetical protein [Betaproteobacteria bacterium]